MPVRELNIRSVLVASPETVWEAWTNPDHLAKWWGPAGFTSTIRKMEVAKGGEWLLTMHGPDGKNYNNKSIFIEIINYRKIVFQHFNPNYLATVIFQPANEGTKLDWTLEFETQEMFATVVRVFKADEGQKQNIEKLKNFLEKTKKE